MRDEDKTPHRVVFIVRLDRDDGGRVRGSVERVRTGEKAPVDGLASVGEIRATMLATDETERRQVQ